MPKRARRWPARWSGPSTIPPVLYGATGRERTRWPRRPAATLTVAEKLLPGATRSGLKIVLTSGVSAFGKVVDERAQPIAAAEVRLVAATAKASLPRYLRPEGDEPEEPAVYSDAQGSFRF